SSSLVYGIFIFFFFSSRRRHTRFSRDWSSDVCSSDLIADAAAELEAELVLPAREGELVVAEHGRGVHEELGPEDVVPASAEGGIGPGDLELRTARLAAIEVEHIAAEVDAEEVAVPVAEAEVGPWTVGICVIA